MRAEFGVYYGSYVILTLTLSHPPSFFPCISFFLSRRVLGILAVTRSFGDHGMKDFVTANPYVTETRCALACDDFLRAAPVGKNLAFLFCLLFLSFIEQIVRVDSSIGLLCCHLCRCSDCGECPMLILACDGVWDVLTDQETTDLLMKRYVEKGGPDEDAAKYIVKTAIKKGSADNITAVVVYL